MDGYDDFWERVFKEESEIDKARAEIARLQSRLQAMTENAERLALGLEEAQYDNVDWRRALDDIDAHRKLMEGK